MMKIYFFTGKSEHSTNIEIMTQLKECAEKDAIEYELVNLQSLNIEQLREILILSAENAQNADILFLLKPDHPNSYEVCKFALDHDITTINNAGSTLKLINRWQIENELKIFVDEMKKDKNILDDSTPLLIDVPKAWFIVTEVDFREDEQEGFIKELDGYFQQEFPLVIKYPINHTGFHFIRKIKNIDELNTLLPLFETSGLIIQKYIENSGTTLKFFNIGSEIIVLTERSNIPDFVKIQDSKDRKKDKSAIAKILLDLNSAEFRDDKLLRKKVDYPKVLETVVKKIGQKLNLDIFGVDMIVDKTGNYYIIDVNDFPGFRGVENIGNVIVNYVKNKRINES